MNTIYIKITLISLVSILFLGCKKDLLDINGDNSVRLSFNNSQIRPNTSNKAEVSNTLDLQDVAQIITTEVSGNLQLKATLIPEGYVNHEKTIINKASNSTPIINNPSIPLDTVRRELRENTKIKILIYNNSNNTLFKEIDHTYKPNGPDLELTDLAVGSTYTFIIYSINSTANIPTPTNKNTLNSLTINGLTSQFMYFKKVLTIARGTENPIPVKLTHQFSEVSTSIEIDQEGPYAGSVVTQMTAPTLSQTYSEASFNLQTGEPIFEQAKLMQSEQVLPLRTSAITQNPITTTPTLVLTNNANNVLTINSLTVNGLLNTVRLSGFSLRPGVRYTLKLELACGCTVDEILNQAFNRANVTKEIEDSFTFQHATYGVVLDFYSIDNSFNLKVNNQHIFEGTAKTISNIQDSVIYTNYRKNEIQFQGYGLHQNRTNPPNIEFQDGTRWGFKVGNANPLVPDIWLLGSAINLKKPIIKVLIDKEGNVLMYGSKNKLGGEPFFPLKTLKYQTVTLENNGTTRYRMNGKFNKVQWNDKGISNTIAFSQLIDDATYFHGSITGKRQIHCTTKVPI